MDMDPYIVDKLVKYVFDPAVRLIFAAGFLLFMWGLVEFLMNYAGSKDGKSDKINDGKQHMIWGIVGMFIMISVGAAIELIDDTFDLGVRDAAAGQAQIRANSGQGATDPFLGRNPYFDETF